MLIVAAKFSAQKRVQFIGNDMEVLGFGFYALTDGRGASMLYFNGVDSVSISKRLGHAQVSTTANIYAHVMEEADQRNADILGDVFLKKA